MSNVVFEVLQFFKIRKLSPDSFLFHNCHMNLYCHFRDTPFQYLIVAALSDSHLVHDFLREALRKFCAFTVVEDFLIFIYLFILFFFFYRNDFIF